MSAIEDEETKWFARQTEFQRYFDIDVRRIR